MDAGATSISSGGGRHMLNAPPVSQSYISIFITHFFGIPAENLEFLRKLYLDFELSSYQIAELTGWSRTSISDALRRAKIKNPPSQCMGSE